MPNLTAAFVEEQFVPQPNGSVAVKITSPATAYYGPGFPDVGQPFLDRRGNKLNGQAWLEVLPDGRVFGYPLSMPDGPLGAWQWFYKQSGVIFVQPNAEASFGFVFKSK